MQRSSLGRLIGYSLTMVMAAFSVYVYLWKKSCFYQILRKRSTSAVVSKPSHWVTAGVHIGNLHVRMQIREISISISCLYGRCRGGGGTDFDLRRMPVQSDIPQCPTRCCERPGCEDVLYHSARRSISHLPRTTSSTFSSCSDIVQDLSESGSVCKSSYL